MTVTMTNGKTRKTLADQLDRLDNILDALSEGLNGAVADAVKEAAGAAVQEAVRQALIEVLTNPDVLTLIGGAVRTQAPAPPAPDVPPVVVDSRLGLREPLGALGSWAGRQVRAARSACTRAAAAGLRGLGGLGARLLPLWQLRKHLLVALGVGAAAGLVAYVAGPWVAALLSGVATFASTVTLQARLWLNRMIVKAGLTNSTS
jgi:hypothetical protein